MMIQADRVVEDGGGEDELAEIAAHDADLAAATMATILTEEMDSAVPRNSAVTSRVLGVGISILPAGHRPSATPQAKGTAMPDSETSRSPPGACG